MMKKWIFNSIFFSLFIILSLSFLISSGLLIDLKEYNKLIALFPKKKSTKKIKLNLL